MSNGETLQEYNTNLAENNDVLDNILNMVNNLPEGGSSVNSNVYSTEETVVGTWLDGRPVYRKTMIIESIGNNVNTEFSYYIENVEKIWINHGVSFINNGYESQSLNWFYSTTDFMRTWVNANLNGIRLRAAADLTAFSGYIVLEYTKTTDTGTEVN